MRKKIFILLGVVALLTVLGFAIQRNVFSNSRARAEAEHGMALPASAYNWQCRGDAWLGTVDRGACTLFQMKSSEVVSFVASLKVSKRSAANLGAGDPTINGLNVWPKGADVIPGNDTYCGFTHNWAGSVQPLEILTCSSPVGDFMLVELWKLEGDSSLVKLYTDWN